MADQESRKILPGEWASAETAVRTDPEDVGIDREQGWDERYEQPGSGFEPELGVVNQRFRELDGWAREHIRSGGVLQYDPDIDYLQGAVVGVGRSKYSALVANGPATSNVTTPGTDDTVWLLY